MHLAKAQGFEEDVSLAISEHYLPIGISSRVPKKPISIAVSLIDKLDMFCFVNPNQISNIDVLYFKYYSDQIKLDIFLIVSYLFNISD